AIGGLGGAAIHTTAPSDVYILGNLVGTDPSGTIAIPNTITGGSIRLQGARRAFVGGSSATDGNIIRGNLNAGVELRGPGNEQNFIVGDSIIANGDAGIAVSASRQNFIQRNILTANPVGIQSTEGSVNRLRRNSIFDNTRAGIEDLTARSPAPPVILQTGFDFVSGVACAGCLIEVFSDAGDEGRWFEGETVAASDGRFTMRKSTILRGPRVSATATDDRGATSVFSATMQTPPRPPRRRAVRH
ncbi:MAG TPA: right-handed parallel beta-helix repeat-containing protein, partial [Rhodothermia bacterium]|nr:right-handed parallel beta-helix repeat-containing protein [Rhodothermia bacterium]